LFYLLYIFYLVLFCWLIWKLKFFKQCGIGRRLLIILFLVRIVFSLVSAYFNLYYYPFSDPLSFHIYGVEEYNLLFSDPAKYFTDFFSDTRGNHYSGFFATSDSFWNDAKSNLIIKLLSIFDIFSGKNYFINSLFYNFLVFFGVVALFKVFNKAFPGSFYQVIFCIFLLPSALFFSSMIHRDGLTLLSLSMVIYQLYFSLIDKFSIKRMLLILFFLLMILVLRNFVFITLIPAMVAWIIAHYRKKFAFLSFAIVYAALMILFFSSSYISPQIDLPNFVVERQHAFIETAKQGASSIKIEPLQPYFLSFLKNAPQALEHSLLRPHPSKISNLIYAPFVLEIIIIGILFLVLIFFPKTISKADPLMLFCFFFSVSMFIVIGYTVPIVGAIVRYRSIYFIFLMLPILCNINWEKFVDKIDISKNKIWLFLSKQTNF